MIVDMDAAFKHKTLVKAASFLCIERSFFFFQESGNLCIDGMQEVRTR